MTEPYHFPTAKIVGDNFSGKVTFIKDKNYPSNTNVTAILTFAITENCELMLVKHAKRGWDIIGGHLEKDELFFECIKRESLEEAGIEIGFEKCIGYLKLIYDFNESKYPNNAIMLVFVSKVIQIFKEWEKYEINERKLVSFECAESLFKKRNDNELMFNIFKIVKKEIDYGKKLL